MNTQNSNISVIDPISPAFERVKTILFRPFDLTRWFVIGFCAWLAYLGQGGGGSNFTDTANQDFHHAGDFFTENMPWIIPLIIGGIILGIVLWVVFTWLSSRGRFMFLHCVATNKAEVKVPWRSFSRHGNSLFLFRIVAGLISFICFALLGGAIILLIVISAGGKVAITAPVPAIAGLIALSIIIIPLVIAVALLFKFTHDFVVPIMFLQTASCVDAWRRFWPLLSKNIGKFIVYILFQIVISMVEGAIIISIVCGTCCVAGCILAIPYVGTVLLLPMLVFDRSYSLLYFRQFGPDFDVFAPETA
jgi:hypothetical protein